MLLGQKEDAKLAYKNAVECVKVINRNVYSMHNMIKMAYVYERLASSMVLDSETYEEAISYYKLALQSANRVNKVKGSLQSLKGGIQMRNNMGNACMRIRLPYMEEGNLEEADRYFQKEYQLCGGIYDMENDRFEQMPIFFMSEKFV